MNPVFVTGNPNKADYLGRLMGVELDHEALVIDEIQSTDMRAITEEKARQAYAHVHRPVVVEDVGLYFEALGDLPGPFIKFFVEQDNGLDKLCRMLDGFESRRAQSVVLTTYFDGETFTHFEGGSHGTIAEYPRGKGGFGYDAIWCVDGYDGRTRAELNQQEDEESYAASRPIEQMRKFFSERSDG